MLALQATVDVSDPRELVRVGPEAPSRAPVGALWHQIERLYESGLHPAIGLCVRHRGQVVLDRTIGHVEHAPGASPGPVATPDTLFNLFSASKILTATVIAALIEDGRIDLERRVCDYLPGFERHGKDGITVRHLLNHTAGIPDMPTDVDPVACLSRGQLPVEALYDLVPATPPGANVAYHPITSWVLLEGIVERVTGSDLRRVATERLLAPLGFSHMNYGVPEQDLPRVARHATTGPPVAPPMARIFERTIGVDLATAVSLTNDPAFLTAILPSANVCATGRETTRFLQLLLQRGELDGTRVLAPETVDRMIGDATPKQLDSTFGFPMRYGLGLMLGGNRFSLYGLGTRQAFGHLGFTNVVVYADPSRDLAVSLLNTGKPMLAPGMVRWYWVLQRIALAFPRRGGARRRLAARR